MTRDTYCQHCNTLLHTAIHCNTWQHMATHCKSLQHVAATRHTRSTPQHIATDCNTPYEFHRSAPVRLDSVFKSAATHCSTRQHTATPRTIPQHTPTHPISSTGSAPVRLDSDCTSVAPAPTPVPRRLTDNHVTTDGKADHNSLTPPAPPPSTLPTQVLCVAAGCDGRCATVGVFAFHVTTEGRAVHGCCTHE